MASESSACESPSATEGPPTTTHRAVPPRDAPLVYRQFHQAVCALEDGDLPKARAFAAKMAEIPEGLDHETISIDHSNVLACIAVTVIEGLLRIPAGELLPWLHEIGGTIVASAATYAVFQTGGTALDPPIDSVQIIIDAEHYATPTTLPPSWREYDVAVWNKNLVVRRGQPIIEFYEGIPTESPLFDCDRVFISSCDLLINTRALVANSAEKPFLNCHHRALTSEQSERGSNRQYSCCPGDCTAGCHTSIAEWDRTFPRVLLTWYPEVLSDPSDIHRGTPHLRGKCSSFEYGPVDRVKIVPWKQPGPF